MRIHRYKLRMHVISKSIDSVVVMFYCMIMELHSFPELDTVVLSIFESLSMLLGLRPQQRHLKNVLYCCLTWIRMRREELSDFVRSI